MYFNAVRDCKRCHTGGEEFQPSKPPRSLYLFGDVGFGVGFHVVCLSKVERVAIEVAFATVDQSDIRGSKPHNRDPSGAASH